MTNWPFPLTLPIKPVSAPPLPKFNPNNYPEAPL